MHNNEALKTIDDGNNTGSQKKSVTRNDCKIFFRVKVNIITGISVSWLFIYLSVNCVFIFECLLQYT